jgi:hypothetical protein
MQFFEMIVSVILYHYSAKIGIARSDSMIPITQLLGTDIALLSLEIAKR